MFTLSKSRYHWGDNPVIQGWLVLDIVYIADIGVASIQNLLDFNVTSGTVAKSFGGAPKC